MWDECEIPGVHWCPQDTRSAWRSSASGFCVKSCLVLRCCSWKCLLQGISLLEESTVFTSTGSAVDQRFAWLSNDSLKHTPEGLVIIIILFFFTICIGAWLSKIQNCVVLWWWQNLPISIWTRQEPLTSSCLPFPLVALCKCILCLPVMSLHFTHRFS